MRVRLVKTGYHEAALSFRSDELDAVPPLEKIFFKAKNIGRVSKQRWALVSYLLTREILGNSLELEGMAFPAHVAYAAQKDFDGDEFFIHPLNNTPEAILPTGEGRASFRLGSIQARNAASECAVNIKTHNLGFSVAADPSASIEAGLLKTNLSLWVGLVGRNGHEVLAAVLTLILSDVHGLRTFEWITEAESDVTARNQIRHLLGEVGLHVEIH